MGERKSNRPRRLITRVRRQVGRETLVHRAKNKYNRRRQKARTRELVNKYVHGAKERAEELFDNEEKT